MAIVFPASRIREFYRDNPTWKEKGLRLGQAFFNYMELHKVVNEQDKAVCDALFNADNIRANNLIISHTDWKH